MESLLKVYNSDTKLWTIDAKELSLTSDEMRQL